MNFKFDFLSEDGETHNDHSGTSQSDALQEYSVEELHFSTASTYNKVEETPHKFTQIKLEDGKVVKYIMQEEEHDIAGIGDHTDLVPGVYEGGWKTWACSYILLDYLCETYPVLGGDKRVLELGCGSGLPGLYCLLKGAAVTFQDYNKDVLQKMTMHNVHLTCSGDKTQLGRCKFFSGDWRHFHDLMVEKHCRFDVILTSETIYNCSSYEKLHNIFSACLSENGHIYIACKCHYFGVGGGDESFKQYVKSQAVFDIETVLTTDEDLYCCILRLSRKLSRCSGS